MELLTERELSRKTKLAEVTLRTFRRQGRGPKYLKISKAVRYRVEDVDTWLKRFERNGGGSE